MKIIRLHKIISLNVFLAHEQEINSSIDFDLCYGFLCFWDLLKLSVTKWQYYPPAIKTSRDVTNLTERKNLNKCNGRFWLCMRFCLSAISFFLSSHLNFNLDLQKWWKIWNLIDLNFHDEVGNQKTLETPPKPNPCGYR